ncbi:MarR family winged helix-turn-helix transcriptional regulator [Paracoccus suum]|nr:MarR family transcriptional regulator [Paracoccus suum]
MLADDVTRQSIYEGRAGRDVPQTVDGIPEDSPLRPRLWGNPCWFSYRLNYLALHFNNPVYGMIQSRLGLLRPEFVVLWSLYLGGPSVQTDVVRASGFPKNTLSRAANKVHRLGLIERKDDAEDQRRITLHLTEKGRQAVESVKDDMLAQERQMLDCLSPAERLILSEILTKLVSASGGWSQTFGDEPAGEDEPAAQQTEKTGAEPAVHS